MTYGVQILNEVAGVQIDSDFDHLGVVASGTYTQSGADVTLSYPQQPAPPLIFARLSQGSSVAWVRHPTSTSTTVWVSGTVSLFVVGTQGRVSDGSTHGLEVYTPNGNTGYSSRMRFPVILSQEEVILDAFWGDYWMTDNNTVHYVVGQTFTAPTAVADPLVLINCMDFRTVSAYQYGKLITWYTWLIGIKRTGSSTFETFAQRFGTGYPNDANTAVSNTGKDPNGLYDYVFSIFFAEYLQ